MIRRVLLTVAALTVAGLALTPGSAAADGPVTVEATLSQTALRVGDAIELRLTVVYPREVKVEIPDLTDKLGGLEVLQLQQRATGRQLDGTQTLTLEYRVSGYIPGRYQLPPISVAYATADGQQGVAVSPGGAALEVQSVLTSPNEPFRDIKPPLAIEREPAPWTQTAASAVLGLGVPLLLVLAGRRLLRRRPLLRAGGALSAEEEAGAALARLAALTLSKPADFLEYYGGVSNCVRRFLDRRYELSATTSTSREVRRAMEARGIHPWQARIISDLLDECDAARWAHYQPDVPRARRAVTIALEIVDLAGGERPDLSAAVGGGTTRRDAF